MPADERDKLANCVRQFRFQHGEMTQQDLAVRIGVTRQTIIAIEAGKYVPSLLLAMKIAATFGVPVEMLFQLDGSNKQPGKR